MIGSIMKKDIFRVLSTNLIKTFVTLITAFFIPTVLSVEQYGYYKLFSLYVSYVGVSHLGFCDGIFLKYGGKEFECIDKRQLASEQKTFFFYEIILTIAVTLIGTYKKDLIIILFGLTFLPSTLINFYANLYQAIGDFQQYSRIYKINSILMLVLNAILVFFIKGDKGIYYACLNVFINYLVFLFSYLRFNKVNSIKNGRCSFQILINPIKSGFLLMLGNLSYILFSSIDKWFVKGSMGMQYFAYYSFAVQLLSIMNMFINPIGLTFYSYMSKYREREFEYLLKTRIISILFLMLSGVFAIKFVVIHFIEKYAEAIPVIEVLFLAQIFLLLNTAIYVNLFKVYKMQKRYFFNLVIVIGISIALNVLLFMIMGRSMMSFAVATLVSMVIWSWCNLKSFPYLKLKKAVLCFGAFCIVFYWLANSFDNVVCGGIVYYVGWGIGLRVFMKECFGNYLGKIWEIKEKVLDKL